MSEKKKPKPRPQFDGRGKKMLDTLDVGNLTGNDYVDHVSQGAFGDSRNALRANPYYWASPGAWAIEASDAITRPKQYVEDRGNSNPGSRAFEKTYAKAFPKGQPSPQKALGEGILKGNARAAAIAKAKAKSAPKPAAPKPAAPKPAALAPALGTKGSSSGGYSNDPRKAKKSTGGA